MRADARKAGNVVSLPDAVDFESLGAESPGLDEDDGLILDTEIIAIYW